MYMCVSVCVSVCSLPERIRPTVVAFGGVADGFVPFDAQTEDGKQEVELQMASVVMKAVQVLHFFFFSSSSSPHPPPHHVLMLLPMHSCTWIVTLMVPTYGLSQYTSGAYDASQLPSNRLDVCCNAMMCTANAQVSM